MTARFSSFIRRLPVVFATALTLVAGGPGCTYFRTIGSGAHMDRTQSRPSSTDHRTRTIVVEVTTDPQGQVANIAFKRSSGKEGIDGYVAETIHQNWPQQASTRTVAEITYTRDNGFSQPKVLSSGPVQ